MQEKACFIYLLDRLSSSLVFRELSSLMRVVQGLSKGSVGKESTCNVETQFDAWVRKIPGEGNGYALQYSCLEDYMNRGALAGYSP